MGVRQEGVLSSLLFVRNSENIIAELKSQTVASGLLLFPITIIMFEREIVRKLKVSSKQANATQTIINAFYYIP